MLKYKAIVISLLLVGFFVFLISWQVRSFVYEISYDLSHDNLEVTSKVEVDEILRSFIHVDIDKVDSSYLRGSGISNHDYVNMYNNLKFYIIEPQDIYKRIVGRIRVRDLVSRDDYYQSSIMNRSKNIYWVMNKKILYRLIELRNELRSKGFSENGFEVEHGYRTPKHNGEVGGAPKSRHIKGEAVDIIINDINGDGKYTSDDKQIVINILENTVIKNSGGIGLYPETRVLHMDVRGYRARWDSY